MLRRGDQGAEVVELQRRLHQVDLYRDGFHGRFTHRVEDAVRAYQWRHRIQGEWGVYGAETRSRLEAETQGR